MIMTNVTYLKAGAWDNLSDMEPVIMWGEELSHDVSSALLISLLFALLLVAVGIGVIIVIGKKHLRSNSGSLRPEVNARSESKRG